MMKSNIIRYFLIPLSFVSAFACRRFEADTEMQSGYLYVSLDTDKSEEIVFKSLESPGEDMVFSLTVYDFSDKVVAEVPDYRELAESPLRLNVGTYRLVASSSSAGAAAFDAPCYSGSTEFRVLPEQVTNIDVTCTLANVKVTAEFSQEIMDNFKTVRLTVSNGEGGLVYDSANGTLSKEGFFSVTGQLDWSLYLENNDGVVYQELTDSYTDVKPRQHYNLSFKLGAESDFGGGALTVIVDNSMEEKEYDLVLDFGHTKAPELSSNFGYDPEVPLIVNAGDQTSKVLSFVAEEGFKNFILKYPSDAARSVAGNEVDLVGATAEEISSLASAGIVASAVEPGQTEVSVDITSYVAGLTIGESFFSILAADNRGGYRNVEMNLVIQSPVDVQALSADPWAMFATLKAKWFTESEPEGLSFQYRKSSAEEWIDADASDVVKNTQARTYSLELRGLEPETEYVFRAVSARDKETLEMNFTTETAGTIHNMSFDNWYQGSTWMPNLDSSFSVWDSANPGSGSFGITPTTPESSDVAVPGEGKKAARLESKKALIVLAAGNIYTGKFGKTDGLGASLDWGVPFESRPLAMKGYYKYTSRTIDMAKAPYTSMKGQPDICQIFVMLTDWEKPFTVNTNSGSFVDFDNDPAIIAYGKLEDNTSSESYKEFTIKLDYRDLSRKPKYAVVVACASKYGDYFTGGVGSTLLVDEFSFIYDPNQLTE